MSPEEVKARELRKLDARLAGKVLDWDVVQQGGEYFRSLAGVNTPLPRFTQDIGAAWLLVEKAGAGAAEPDGLLRLNARDAAEAVCKAIDKATDGVEAVPVIKVAEAVKPGAEE